jgi:hypothetical protein
MNKILIGATALASLVPVMMFASSDDISGLPTGKRMFAASGMIQPSGTGAMIAMELKTLHESAQKLTLEQRIELTKMIRSYIESKGITVPALPQVKAVRQEIKEIRKVAKEEIKVTREKAKTEIKTKRDEMKLKVQGKRGDIDVSTTSTGIVITGTVSM